VKFAFSKLLQKCSYCGTQKLWPAVLVGRKGTPQEDAMGLLVEGRSIFCRRAGASACLHDRKRESNDN
jgi:hypothetical protein